MFHHLSGLSTQSSFTASTTTGAYSISPGSGCNSTEVGRREKVDSETLRRYWADCAQSRKANRLLHSLRQVQGNRTRWWHVWRDLFLLPCPHLVLFPCTCLSECNGLFSFLCWAQSAQYLLSVSKSTFSLLPQCCCNRSPGLMIQAPVVVDAV